MRKDLTDITLVVDRSGSMDLCKDEACKGINTFIEDQKDLPGDARFSLLQFDTQQDWVHKGTPIRDVGHYELVPRGLTALLDAVGCAIKQIGERLSKAPIEDRPGLVIVAIITDGQENASCEFTRGEIKRMIAHQSEKYNWKFTYLGANQDAITEAGKIGINSLGTASYDVKNIGLAYATIGREVTSMRNCASTGIDINFTYSEEDRKNLEK